MCLHKRSLGAMHVHACLRPHMATVSWQAACTRPTERLQRHRALDDGTSNLLSDAHLVSCAGKSFQPVIIIRICTLRICTSTPFVI